MDQGKQQVQVYIHKCNIAENRWLTLAGDVAVFIFGTFDFTCRELLDIGLTCKTWYKHVQNNNVGVRLQNRVGMVIKPNEPWLKTYKLWLTCQNHFIVLDVSISMDEPFQESTRLKCGINMVKEIAGKVLPVAIRGLYVVIFSDNCLIKHTRTFKEVSNLLEDHQGTQGGTNIFKVFQEIFRWHKNQGNAVPFGHPVKKPTLSNVYIISDFEIGYGQKVEDEVKQVNESGIPMAFHCFQMGTSDQGQEFVGELMGYNDRQDNKISCIDNLPPDDDPESSEDEWSSDNDGINW